MVQTSSPAESGHRTELAQRSLIKECQVHHQAKRELAVANQTTQRKVLNNPKRQEFQVPTQLALWLAKSVTMNPRRVFNKKLSRAARSRQTLTSRERTKWAMTTWECMKSVAAPSSMAAATTSISSACRTARSNSPTTCSRSNTTSYRSSTTSNTWEMVLQPSTATTTLCITTEGQSTGTPWDIRVAALQTSRT